MSETAGHSGAQGAAAAEGASSLWPPVDPGDRPSPPPRPLHPPLADGRPAPMAPASDPKLKCPFCGSTKFDDGRDLFAGGQPILYCRLAPAPGRLPSLRVNLPVMASVCLDCGFVLTMVDLASLRAPLGPGPTSSLARLAENAEPVETDMDEAAKALEKLSAVADTDTAPAPTPPAESAAPKGPATGDDGFENLASLLDRAANREDKPPTGPRPKRG